MVNNSYPMASCAYELPHHVLCRTMRTLEELLFIFIFVLHFWHQEHCPRPIFGEMRLEQRLPTPQTLLKHYPAPSGMIRLETPRPRYCVPWRLSENLPIARSVYKLNEVFG